MRPVLFLIPVVLLAAAGLVFLRGEPSAPAAAGNRASITRPPATPDSSVKDAGASATISPDPAASPLTEEQTAFIYAHVGKDLPARPKAPEGVSGLRILPTPNGTVLAGSMNRTPYLSFTQEDYDAARMTDRTILLVFYSTWCTLCRQEEPLLFAAFDRIEGNSLVAFRVNYKDDDTDVDEKALAEEYTILTQPAKIILHPGQPPVHDFGMWGKDTVVRNLKMISEE
jgi:thiol-disulfide isomerase/thioredoxin